MRRMLFSPAVALVTTATPQAWCFAFVEGQLLWPEAEATFAPQPWDVFEPLQPARSLYGRLRSLLVDTAAELRVEIAAQQRRAELRQRAADTTRDDPPAEAPSAPMPPQRDPDAL